MTSMAMTVSDSLTITRLNLIKVKRVPDLIVFATLSPIMFVLLFRYVFGSAIPVPGWLSYIKDLPTAIFFPTVVFGGTLIGYKLDRDLQNRLIHRFLSLTKSCSTVMKRPTGSSQSLNMRTFTLLMSTGVVV